MEGDNRGQKKKKSPRKSMGRNAKRVLAIVSKKTPNWGLERARKLGRRDRNLNGERGAVMKKQKRRGMASLTGWECAESSKRPNSS